MNHTLSASSHFIDLNGLKIHYLEWSHDQDQAVILLHGLRGYARNWDSVAQELGQRYRVLALDQRGRGDSDWSSGEHYYTPDYVADLEEFVDALGLDRFILIGHSMGGINAVAYAADHPHRVVAAIIEDVGPWPETQAGWGRIAGELDNAPSQFASWDEGKEFLAKQWGTRSTSELEDRAQNSLRTLGSGVVTWKYDIRGITRARSDLSRRIQLWPYVERLECPTLVLRGEHSDVLSRETADRMTECNVNVEWEEVSGVGHLIHDHNLNEFLAAVTRFMTSRISSFSS